MVSFKVKLKFILNQVTFVDKILLFFEYCFVPRGLDCDCWMI